MAAGVAVCVTAVFPVTGRGMAASPQARLAAGPVASSLLDVLQSEMQRNFDVLKAQSPPLYFLSYTVHDARAMRLGAAFGALTERDESHDRMVTVDARVGDYSFDSTHQIRGEWSGGWESLNRTALPLVDEEQAIRHALWRATDRQFRRAVERYTKVQANVASKVQEEAPAPDFSREAPSVFLGGSSPSVADAGAWDARLRRLSAPFADDGLVFRGSASLTVESDLRHFVSSEGSRIRTATTWAHLVVEASTKADDGMELPLTATYSAPTVDGLPSENQLLRDVKEMAALLRQLRVAPVVDPYSGPAILSGRAAAVFFHEIFGHRIEGHRQKNVDEGQTFANKVGEPVLPSFLSVISDPTLEALGGLPLVGHYDYDDEGVKSQRVVVVDGGILKNFLLGRSPLAAFPRSNGHGRAAVGAAPISRQSNLIVQSARTLADARLVEMLKDECRRQGKPSGLFFDNIEGGQTYTGRDSANSFNVVPTVVRRIYVDGRPPELVRGVDLIGTPLAAFGKILATGSTVETFNGFCGAESGMVPVSASSPALLVSEVEVQKKPRSQETSPILPAPQQRRR